MQYVVASDLRTQAPAVILRIEAEYTEAARRAGVEGAVLLYSVIGVDGRAQSIHVIRGLGYGLDEKAIEAVGQWRFDPGVKNGVATGTPATIAVQFRLGTRGPVRI
jgi:periplasmic protein TonB